MYERFLVGKYERKGLLKDVSLDVRIILKLNFKNFISVWNIIM
jgi:hypothetical protein